MDSIYDYYSHKLTITKKNQKKKNRKIKKYIHIHILYLKPIAPSFSFEQFKFFPAVAFPSGRLTYNENCSWSKVFRAGSFAYSFRRSRVYATGVTYGELFCPFSSIPSFPTLLSTVFSYFIYFIFFFFFSSILFLWYTLACKTPTFAVAHFQPGENYYSQ